MLTLGDLLAQARAATPAFEHWLETAAPDLADRVRSAAAAEGQTPGRFARSAVAAFDRDADPQAWTRLTGRLQGADDPGRACLEEMVRWRLSVPRAGRLEET